MKQAVGQTELRDRIPQVFLSYEGKSKDKVDVVRLALLDESIKCWMAPYDIPAGERWNEAFMKALEDSSVFVVFLTSACQDSDYVKQEVLRAINLQLKIVVICLEAFRPVSGPLAVLNHIQSRNAYGGPIEDYLDEIIGSIDNLLPKQELSIAPVSSSPTDILSNLVYSSLITGFLNPTIASLPRKLKGRNGIGRHYRFDGNRHSRSLNDVPLSHIFETALKKLLITGDRGSGKTILLLQLMKDLLPPSSDAIKGLVPVYFHAATWAEPRKSIDKQPDVEKWIISRLKIDYHIQTEAAEGLVKKGHIIYCIDGLDDLYGNGDEGSTDRSSGNGNGNSHYRVGLTQRFFEGLNKFVGLGVPIILVCSPSLQRVLNIDWKCIEIEQWGPEDLLEYLENRHLQEVSLLVRTNSNIANRLVENLSELNMLVSVLQGEGRLRGLMPLAKDIETTDAFFSEVYNTYLTEKYHQYEEDVKLGNVADPDARADHKHLGENPNSKLSVTLQSIQRFAPAIAAYIGFRKQDEFFRLDTLQPSDLPKAIQDEYRLTAGILIGSGITVSAGLPVVLSVALEWKLNGATVNHALTQSMYAAIGYVIVGIIAAIGYRYARNWKFGAVVGLAFAVGKAFASGCAASSPGFSPGWDAAYHNGIFAMVAGVPIFALIFKQMGDEPYRIEPIETWDPDTSKIVYWMLAAVALASLFALGLGWAKGIAFGVLLATFSWARFGKKPKEAPLRVRPNQAILFSWENARYYTFWLTLTTTTVTGLCYGIAYSARLGIMAAVMALSVMVIFFFFGGMPVLKHVALRATLKRKGLIPPNLGLWLKTAVGIGLLRQVGGGYAFASQSSREEYANRLSRVSPGLEKLMWGKSRVQSVEPSNGDQ